MTTPGYPQQPPPGMYPPPIEKKTPNTRVIIILAVIGGIILLCGFGGCVAALSGDKADKVSTTTAPLPTPPSAAQPAGPTQTVQQSSAAQPVPNLTVPELAGVNAAIAGDKLEDLGFTNIQYASATPGVDLVIMRANWTVVSIEPGVGSVIPADSMIIVTVTKNNA
ncbi:hypothetical protein [Nocardia cyriacigeorgica]|uniref:hypothetical protein n=1 Tax=Nocardia cyriacigeorgica TaxID=135487 RepID=UPI002458D739|nr:hypothetical protein [Nocardia cyriacigeorgica]